MIQLKVSRQLQGTIDAVAAGVTHASKRNTLDGFGLKDTPFHSVFGGLLGQEDINEAEFARLPGLPPHVNAAAHWDVPSQRPMRP